MRGDRRRSPPRDERRFSGGGGRGWDGGRRRQRSPSPDRFRRGSPPGKRYRRDDYDDYDRPGGRFDRGDNYGHRGRDRYDDRYDDRPPPPRGPMTFVEFCRDLPPQMGPEQANSEYRRYLADWWGDAIKAEFEERKHEAGVRRRFDPREIARVQERRNELAQAAATSLAAEFTEGGTLADEEHAPPGPDGFTDEAAAERDRAEQEREGEPAPALAPALCWKPAQVAADLALAKQLMATVDKEKGIVENPLLPRPAAADAAAAEGGAGGEGEGAAGSGEQAAAEGEQGEEGQQAAAADQQQQQGDGGEGGSGPADMDAELSPEEQLAKLDQVLAYLWRVHGIDFYGGREFTNPAERGRAVARRTRRGPQPSAAELAAAAEAAAEGAGSGEAAAAAGEGDKAEQQEGEAAGEGAGEGAAAAEGEEGAAPATSPTAAAAEAKSPTAAGGSALAARQGGAAAAAGAAEGGAAEDEKEYERRVTGFWKFRIEKGDPLEGPLQRKRIEEGVEAFVEAQIIKIEDNKWGNKLSQKMFMGREFVVKHIRNKHGHVLEAERERLQEEAFWENFRAFKQEEQRRQEEEQERVMAGMAGRGPAALGAGGVLPLEGAPVLNPAGGMVMAPILMPAAGGMAPIIMPVDMVMGMGMAGAMGGRGGRGGMRGMPAGGRGSGRGGRGPMPGAKLDAGGTVREYYDLDAPQNNRAVLDYGDL